MRSIIRSLLIHFGLIDVPGIVVRTSSVQPNESELAVGEIVVIGGKTRQSGLYFGVLESVVWCFGYLWQRV